MVQLEPAHGAQVELEALEVHDEGRRQLLDGAPALSGDSLPTFLAKVAVIALEFPTRNPPPKKTRDDDEQEGKAEAKQKEKTLSNTNTTDTGEHGKR